MAEFVVKGGYEVPTVRQKSGGFWIDEAKIGLLLEECPSFGKIGCYVFARKGSRGSTPIYVGKTERQTILKEAFNPRNINAIFRWLNDQTQRKLQIWTVTQPGRGRPQKLVIDEIETILIHWARLENQGLLNKQKTKDANWWIKGVERPGRGRRPSEAVEFRKLMGID